MDKNDWSGETIPPGLDLFHDMTPCDGGGSVCSHVTPSGSGSVAGSLGGIVRVDKLPTNALQQCLPATSFVKLSRR